MRRPLDGMDPDYWRNCTQVHETVAVRWQVEGTWRSEPGPAQVAWGQ